MAKSIVARRARLRNRITGWLLILIAVGLNAWTAVWLLTGGTS